jgi:SsrA-binding protein
MADLASNRRATHDYEILETYEAGISLTGTEIKSIRDHGASLAEAYVRVVGGELWLMNASIAPFKHGTIYNHEERRDRKLLMKKREILKLKSWTQEKGLTLVPLALFERRGWVKLRFARARGKKAYDRRAAIKTREAKRAADQAIRGEKE